MKNTKKDLIPLSFFYKNKLKMSLLEAEICILQNEVICLINNNLSYTGLHPSLVVGTDCVLEIMDINQK